MKFEMNDTEHFSWVEMKPETAEEMSMLLRLTNSTLRETPSITLWYGDRPMCMIQFKKKKDPYQFEAINNIK